MENSEGWSKLGAGLGFVLGGVLDKHVNNLAIKMNNPALTEAAKHKLKLKHSSRALLARGLNVGCGAVFAVFDIYHGIDEGFNKGNPGMMGLYFMSAGVGFGSVLLIGSEAALLSETIVVAGTAMSWNHIGWILLAASFAIGIGIALLTNNPIEEWIENSIWGHDEIYKDHEQDIKEYINAIKKMGG